MKIFYVFLNSVFGKWCCYDYWSDWHPSSLSCGRICKHRTRDIVEGFLGGAGALVSGGLECKDLNSCERDAKQLSSCETIDCRKYD